MMWLLAVLLGLAALLQFAVHTAPDIHDAPLRGKARRVKIAALSLLCGYFGWAAFLGQREHPWLLLPELTDGTVALDELREMGNLDASWPLVDGTGIVYGLYVIESLTETKTVFLPNGAARRIDFQLQLERVDDGQTDSIGDDEGIEEDTAA